MTPKTILVLILAAAVAIGGIFYFVNLGRVLDRSGAIDSLVTPILEKFGLVEEDLVRESREVGRKGLKRYLHTFREYSAGGVDFKKFTQALEAGLKKTPYLLARRDYFLARGEEEAYYVVRFKEYDLFSMRLKKKALARPAATAKKRFANPRVVIVLDDFGNNMNNVEALFSIGIPVTLSILPNLKYSSRIAREALDRGYEVILHLPLASHACSHRSTLSIDTWPDNTYVARMPTATDRAPGAPRPDSEGAAAVRLPKGVVRAAQRRPADQPQARVAVV